MKAVPVSPLVDYITDWTDRQEGLRLASDFLSGVAPSSPQHETDDFTDRRSRAGLSWTCLWPFPTLQAFMGHRSIANTVLYTAIADRRVLTIWNR
jgi:hypothetical protein